ncbi:MAG: HlyD family secretion protein, partial [Phycisphaerae bacterium]|nr:HlyD family secretion protein [Phycisphaerae bacterium]
YDPDNLYVTANLEETRLEGVAIDNSVDLDVDAFNPRFRGKVIKIGKATGAKFALIPRDNSAGEFTKVVQRVPIKIAIERDDRWSKLRPGLSVTIGIEHSEGK